MSGTKNNEDNHKMFREIAKSVVRTAIKNMIFTNPPSSAIIEEDNETPYKGTRIGFGCQLKK